MRRLWKLAQHHNQIKVVNPRGEDGPHGNSTYDAIMKHLNDNPKERATRMQGLSQQLEQLKIQEAAQDELEEIYTKNMHRYGRYASKYEWRDQWNFAGVVRSTSWERDTTGLQTGARVPHPMVNICFHDIAPVENYWANGLRAGMELYLIHTRHRMDNGSYTYFKWVPWHGPGQTRPSIQDRIYRDIDGRRQLADMIHVGTVHEDSENINAVPDSSRRMALNLLDKVITNKEADNEAARLDIIYIRVRGTYITD
jgi:hypothetical protein